MHTPDALRVLPRAFYATQLAASVEKFVEPYHVDGNQWKKIAELSQLCDACLRRHGYPVSRAGPSSRRLGYEADASTHPVSIASAVEDVVKRKSKPPEGNRNMDMTIDSTTFTGDAWSNGAKPAWDFSMIEGLVNLLPPIQDIWAALPNSEAIAELRRREELLGVATLSCHAFVLLHEIITNLGTYSVIRRHLPSVTAAAKQTVLNAGLGGVGLLVNKTVTVRLGTTHVLCTGVGDFTLNRCVLSQVAGELRLSKRTVKACRINPPDYSPEYELGLLTGMVSLFFAPAARRKRLPALVLFEATEISPAGAQLVAISLSPFESLIVPRVDFGMLTQLYVQRAHSDLQWAKIDR